MKYDKGKVDEVILALLHLTRFEDDFGVRAWKGHDFGHMNRLYEKGYIGNPKSKAKSVVLTEEGRQRAAALFEQYFGRGEGPPSSSRS